MKAYVPLDLPELATPVAPASGWGRVYFKADGLPYVMGDDGVERGLIKAVSALHANPGFEGTWANGNNSTPQLVGLCPPGWTYFWCGNGVTAAQETVDKTEGLYAVKMTKPAGAVLARLHSSAPFAVSPGDTITVEADVKMSVNGIAYLDIVSAATQAGAEFLSGDTTQVSASVPFALTGGAAYRRVSAVFTIPAGNLWCRISSHFDTTGNVIGSWWVDNTASVAVSPPAATGLVPTGAVEMFASSVIPAGWLECDGAAVSRTTYATLFGLIGTNYGVGNGTTTFNVPNMLGRVPAGYASADSDFSTMGKTGGAKTHTLAVAELPVQNVWSENIGVNNWGFANGTGRNFNTTAPIGGGGAHNNMQPYLTVRFIIKT